MAVTLPAEYDAGVVQLHEDASFTVTARINVLRFLWDNLVFEARREQDGFRGRTSNSGESRRLDESGLWEAEEVAFGALATLRAGNSVSVPTTVERADGGNSTSAFRLVRHCGLTSLEVMRSRKVRYFMHLPQASSWIETDDREGCDIWNLHLKSVTGRTS